jgi:hypothetical protein
MNGITGRFPNRIFDPDILWAEGWQLVVSEMNSESCRGHHLLNATTMLLISTFRQGQPEQPSLHFSDGRDFRDAQVEFR